MIGEILGSYRIVAKIGEGGMGAVYLAEHPAIGRQAAIKVLLPEFCNNPEALDRFFNEARATARLRHPALVDVFDFGTKGGSAFIIMDYLPGESLGTRLRRDGRLPFDRAADLASQIAGGVAVAHAAGIIHRDLKPDNVFLMPDPTGARTELVKILDFGIAKLSRSDAGARGRTQTGAVLGTPLFMSPEQCKGSANVDTRTDVYSLGGILFALLAARPPFDYESPGELIGAHLHEPAPSVRAFAPEVPEALDRLLLSMLAKKPEQRPASMNELIVALAPFLLGARPADNGRVVQRTLVMGDDSRSRVAAARAQNQPAKSTPAPTPMRPTELLPVAAAEATRATTFSGSTGTMSAVDDDLDVPVVPWFRRPAVLGGGGLLVAGVVAAAVFATGGAPKEPQPIPSAGPGVGEIATSAAPRPVTAETPNEPAWTPKPTEPAPAPAVAEAPRPAPEPVAVEAPKPPAAEAPKPAMAEATKPPRPHAEAASKPAVAAPRADTVVISVKNPRGGLVVTVDGKPARLPVRLPRDNAEHVLRFEAPGARAEVQRVRADGSKSLTLSYRPPLLIGD